ncbi:senecionine N-oxygenase-like [Contarinia nasturtii]|uniref:senecionine N-oxygenase-like n=1 Tax=Contarinia nasturtii TaxID=265458 RepID=UPI0012D3B1EF|nr:senecionine N-oxygenase-like [Contarinia nasturtii]
MKLLITIFAGLVLGLAVNQLDAATVFTNDKRPALNVAIIGAGVTGICSAKHCLAEGHKVTVYEQNEEIGGIWYYTDKIGKDKYGIPIHTSMYQGLRTNVPYQVMSFPDFSYPTNTTQFPPQADVLKYLHSYVNHFDVKKSIRLSRLVVRVLPIENDKWEVLVRNLRTNTYETKIYDVVFVCNGHNSKPFIPHIEGADEFNGQLIHSHDYRKPEPFHSKNILVIGGGTSGIDLVVQTSKVANRVTFSQHKIVNETEEARMERQSLFASNVILKDDVKRFTSTGAEFIDGSHETFDVVFFATGYNFSFPFLSLDAGVYVEKKLVQPLYKQIFNVEHPTMAFIGLPALAATTHMFDFQVRFAMKFLPGAKKLPTKAEMLKDVQIQKTKKLPFISLNDQREYIKELSALGNIEPVADVFLDLYADNHIARSRNHNEFRKYQYFVIDDKSFKKEKYLI